MASSTLVLPQELWWLVCQELVARRDFNSLFNCAMVSKDFAAHALPLLYRYVNHHGALRLQLKIVSDWR